MLDVSAIKPSKSTWSNAVVLVHKKDGGFCIDFQKLNAQTRKATFPLPQIHDTMDALSGPLFRIQANTHGGVFEAIHHFYCWYVRLLPV